LQPAEVENRGRNGGKVNWRDWDDDALAQARREGRLVFLGLFAPWCRVCHDLEENVLSDARVIAAIEKDFIPVRVDSDRRPDLDTRYNVGGWPSLAFLSPDGDLIAGETFVQVPELLRLLDNVKMYWAEHADDVQRGTTLARSFDTQTIDQESGLRRALVDDVIAAMLEKFDHRHGGWGEGQKFAHPESIDFAMVQYAKTGDVRMREVVTKTLDSMSASSIHDRVGGGFFRFSTTRDWRIPHCEKVLDNNALRLRCFLEAWQLFERPAYKEAAEGTIRWITETMQDPETGCFFGSQGDDPEFYALGTKDRGRREAPAIDRTIYTNWNAMVIVSLLRGSVILERQDLRDTAMHALGFLLENLYSKREGMYHYWDGTYHLPGILSDQAYMIQALVIASQFSGDADLLLPAEHLAELLLKDHRAPGGGFFDLPESVRGDGALRRRNRSILENAVLAEALLRLSYLSHRDEFREVARETLLAFTQDYKEYGYYVAGYARAIDLFLYEPMVVTIVGDRGGDGSRQLRLAAQRTYVPSRIVQTLDPASDPVLLSRTGYRTDAEPRAYVSIGKTTRGHYSDPAELAKSMREIEDARHR
jgi:hypothetical protein